LPSSGLKGVDQSPRVRGPGRTAGLYGMRMRDEEAFADVLAANSLYAAEYDKAELEPIAAKGLAVLTCMDSRIVPLAMLGLELGDAKILRNAGARVTGDVLRTLVLAKYLLGVDRIMVIAHSGCRMAGITEDQIHGAIRQAGGPDTRSISFMPSVDQESALVDDVQKVRSWPYLNDVAVGGFVYDLQTGRITQVC
jgi:carbonic anhydrase